MPVELYRQSLLSYNEFMFEEWLRTGFDRYFKGNDGSWSFPGAETLIAGEEDLVSGLVSTYRNLPELSKGYFRVAIVNMLASLPPSANEIETCKALLNLIAELPVPSAIEAINLRVGQGYFGTNSQLFGTTLITVMRLAAPREDKQLLLSCLNQLIDSDNFKCEYAGTALVALCRIDPSNFINHLRVLKDDLVDLFQMPQFDQNRQLSFAKSILDTIGFTKYVNAMVEILALIKLHEYPKIINCFVKNILNPEAGIIKIISTDSIEEFLLRREGHPDRVIPFNEIKESNTEPFIDYIIEETLISSPDPDNKTRNENVISIEKAKKAKKAKMAEIAESVNAWRSIS